MKVDSTPGGGKQEEYMSGVIESKKISDVLSHVKQGSLVAFDIDNTLIWSVQEFGSQPWFIHVSKQYQSKGLGLSESMEKTRIILEQISDSVSFETIDPETYNVLSELEQRGISTIALTSRMFSGAAITIEQLRSVDIDFTNNSLHEKEVIFSDEIAFSEGVLYAGLEEGKGRVLIKFLEKIGIKPDSVLFVDDSSRYVEEVHQSLDEYGIPVTCIRYGGADFRVEAFDPARADKELANVIGEERFSLLFKELL